MLFGQPVHIEVVQRVGIAEEEIFSCREIFDIFQTSSGFKQDRFVAEVNGASAIFALKAISSESFLPPLRAMVRIDDESLETACDEVFEMKFDERLVKNRDEGFGETLGEREETGAETGSRKEGSSHDLQ
jgi:hypothetical protein